MPRSAESCACCAKKKAFDKSRKYNAPCGQFPAQPQRAFLVYSSQNALKLMFISTSVPIPFTLPLSLYCQILYS